MTDWISQKLIEARELFRRRSYRVCRHLVSGDAVPSAHDLIYIAGGKPPRFGNLLSSFDCMAYTAFVATMTLAQFVFGPRTLTVGAMDTSSIIGEIDCFRDFHPRLQFGNSLNEALPGVKPLMVRMKICEALMELTLYIVPTLFLINHFKGGWGPECQCSETVLNVHGAANLDRSVSSERFDEINMLFHCTDSLAARFAAYSSSGLVSVKDMRSGQ